MSRGGWRYSVPKMNELLNEWVVVSVSVVLLPSLTVTCQAPFGRECSSLSVLPAIYVQAIAAEISLSIYILVLYNLRRIYLFFQNKPLLFETTNIKKK